MKLIITPYGRAPRNGDDFGQRDVTDAATGERLGCITREIDWKDVGVVSCSYVAKVTGHTVELYDVASDADRALDGKTFAKLSDATAALRAHFAKRASKVTP